MKGRRIILGLMLLLAAEVSSGSTAGLPGINLADTICYDGKFESDNAGLDDLIPEKGKVAVEIYYPATKASFRSSPARLEIPSRPEAPVYTIDFLAEKTRETVPAEVEYTVNRTTGILKAGNGELLKLTPGENLWFRVKAAGGLFPSPWFLLEVPEAPDVSQIAIDFRQERLTGLPLGAMWKINGGAEKFVQADLSGLIPASHSENLPVQIYVPASTQRFASKVRELLIPARPVISIEEMSCSVSVPSCPAVVKLPSVYQDGVLELKSSDEDIARIEEERIVPLRPGKCTITAVLKAGKDYFASEPVSATLEVTGKETEATPEVKVSKLILANGQSGDTALKFEIQGIQTEVVRLMLFNITGKVIYRSDNYNNDYDMAGLQAGTYYYVLSCMTKQGESVRKGFVEVVK